MELSKLEPPREFGVGHDGRTRIHHCGNLRLEPDEQVTLVTASGTEYDVVRKQWGYYATPSLNQRLPAHGLRPVLVHNDAGRLYLLLVERNEEVSFEQYVTAERLSVVTWLDTDQLVGALTAAARGAD
jgi:hypothetical protein